MKLRRREPNFSPRRLKAAEVAHPIENQKDESIFDPLDFLTADEWERLDTTILTNIVNTTEKYAEADVENFLLSCLALSLLKPETLDKIRASTKAKQVVQQVLSQVEQLPKRPRKVSLTPVACWLWPDLSSIPPVAAQMQKFEKRLGRKNLKATGLQAVLYPDQRENIGMNEGWIKKTLKFMENIDNDIDLDDILYLAVAVFFPPEQAHVYESVAREKADHMQQMSAYRSEGSFAQELRWIVLPLARLRCLLADRKDFIRGGVQIHDRKPQLITAPPLPNRDLS